MAKKIINNWMFAAGSNPVFHQNFVKEEEEEESCEVEEVTALKSSEEEERVLPECLQTAKAMALLKKLQGKGVLDEAFQPVGIKSTHLGVFAFQLAIELEIQNVWEVFGELWKRKGETLRRYYNNVKDQGNYGEILDMINEALE